jgi:hypothetical protein
VEEGGEGEAWGLTLYHLTVYKVHQFPFLAASVISEGRDGSLSAGFFVGSTRASPPFFGVAAHSCYI